MRERELRYLLAIGLLAGSLSCSSPDDTKPRGEEMFQFDLQRAREVGEIGLYETQITKERAEAICRLPDLSAATFVWGTIADDAWPVFGKNLKTKRLVLAHLGPDFESFEDNASIEELACVRCSVSSESIVSVGRMQNLQVFIFHRNVGSEDTSVGSEYVEALSQMKSLKVLMIGGDVFEDDEFDNLNKALTDVHIVKLPSDFDVEDVRKYFRQHSAEVD